MERKDYSIEDVKKAVAENKSVAGVLRQIGLRPVGGNYKTIRRIISEYGLDTSHFTGQGWNVGLQFNPKPIVTNDTVFVKDSNFKCSWRLRERYKKVTGIDHCENWYQHGQSD